LIDILHHVQHDLFNIGGDLATPEASRWQGMVLVSEREPKVLESLMDGMSEALPPLREFVLPGGGAGTVAFHLARTVCRRAERRVAELSKNEPINPHVLIYLNRLSDFFFVAGRYVVMVLGQSEVTWRKQGGLAGVIGSQDA
jgi:cob(I)alamin adenosyltransferase